MTTLYLALGGSAVVGLIVWLAFRYAVKSGGERVRREAAEREAEKIKDATDAQINGPRDKSDLVDRLSGNDPV